MSNTADRRVKRTKRKIRRALIELMNEKEFGAITVQDIAERADINRGTFYLHYQDKYDLFERSVDDILEELAKTVGPTENERRNMARNYPEQQVIRLFSHFQHHSDFYKTMFGDNARTYFHNRFMDMLLKQFSQAFEELKLTPRAVNGINKEIVTHYVLFAHLGVLVNWLEQDTPHSPEYMAKQLESIYDYAYQFARPVDERLTRANRHGADSR
ncbi:TetR/AcrR family transcriptional regulator [Paenibacillus apiarius]|uniref:TetR/AcrR family transcriptional regulator n=1 Tax=Paenibacillus apiarius TaxID=46240 RepID=A0ABT4DU69_9BACL|nr:TetR/AcrR family transcriptional regulator [Paenibacillus apiarius]MCY9513370.1 TetR/AcrR family transcriptional regulator [Paenibacillus apiarius]MCY9519658.1 TetR/AcrR family transcriptional regulator [Paenibacillus apiarius]MCY9553286.1 TetR/AcrR family transcriptional regulator [Paenibacillus apiarius]MCY9557136.1 TetR/AcrR family transcriptional regulator [Paenibacillus apiarius]MCY9682123.1 TetR/AcrR family transcriptional regulator [Paenibacillus apiarius]